MTPQEGRLRIVVVDDHHLFRAGVRAELADHHDVVGNAATPTEALAVIAATHPDVVLLDVHLPGGGGVAVLEALASFEDRPPVLALSVSDAAEDVVPMIRAGALGYVTKTIDTVELLRAIATVAAGEASFSPRLPAFVLQAFTPRRRPPRCPTSSRRSPHANARCSTTSPAATPTSASARGWASAPAPSNPTSRGATQAAALLAPRSQPLGHVARPRGRRGPRVTPVYRCTSCGVTWTYPPSATSPGASTAKPD